MRITIQIAASVVALAMSGSVSAQVVQLPTFQQFTVNTTVSVPDGGSAFLGGVTTARSGSTSNSLPILGRLPVANRLFQNRGIGRDVGASRAFVRAQIIDLREMDDAVLQQARNARLGRQRLAPGQIVENDDLGNPGFRNAQPAVVEDPVEARARFLSQNIGRSSRNPRQSELASPRLSVARTRGSNDMSNRDEFVSAKRKSPGKKSPAAAATPEPPLLLNGKRP